MSYVVIWLQACLRWRCAYFQTLSWNDTIFVVDWDILYKLCGSANKWSKGFVFSGKIFTAIRHVQSIIPVVRPRPNIRSHSVLFTRGKNGGYYMAEQRHEISFRVLKNISRENPPIELSYDEFKFTKCCTKTFCLCWVLRSKIAFTCCVTSTFLDYLWIIN